MIELILVACAWNQGWGSRALLPVGCSWLAVLIIGSVLGMFSLLEMWIGLALVPLPIGYAALVVMLIKGPPVDQHVREEMERRRTERLNRIRPPSEPDQP